MVPALGTNFKVRAAVYSNGQPSPKLTWIFVHPLRPELILEANFDFRLAAFFSMLPWGQGVEKQIQVNFGPGGRLEGNFCLPLHYLGGGRGWRKRSKLISDQVDDLKAIRFCPCFLQYYFGGQGVEKKIQVNFRPGGRLEGYFFDSLTSILPRGGRGRRKDPS